MKRPFHFVIIGGGLTGTSMLHHLVHRIGQKIESPLDRQKITIHIIERDRVFGPGFPYSERQTMPFHLVNMCAQDMGIVAGRPRDFSAWVNDNLDGLRERFPKVVSEYTGPDYRMNGCNYYPRMFMGEYLKARFQEAMEKARVLGIGIELYPECEVTGIEPVGENLAITLSPSGDGVPLKIRTDRVILATGHWRQKGRDASRYFPSPWPACWLLDQIPPGAPVAVLGTSLSAVDTVLTLTSDGRFARDQDGLLVYAPSSSPRKLTLYSRSGLLPKIRGKTGSYRNQFLTAKGIGKCEGTNQGELTLAGLFRLLNADLEAAYGHPIDWRQIQEPSSTAQELLEKAVRDAKYGDGSQGELLWQTVMHQMFPMVRRLYLALSPQERKKFDREYNTVFFNYASILPIINGEKLLALMRAGLLQVKRLGANYRLLTRRKRFELVYEDGKTGKRSDSCAYLVNATGQGRDYAKCPDPLAKSLLANGIIQIDELISGDFSYRTGAVRVDPETHGIVQRGPGGEERVSEQIYAVGAMTRGQIIDASMAYASARTTNRIAINLVASLCRNHRPSIGRRERTV
jgi:uncharacterized NAD(P)/FAD-binding protein YdhS